MFSNPFRNPIAIWYVTGGKTVIGRNTMVSFSKTELQLTIRNTVALLATFPMPDTRLVEWKLDKGPKNNTYD